MAQGQHKSRSLKNIARKRIIKLKFLQFSNVKQLKVFARKPPILARLIITEILSYIMIFIFL